MPKFSAISVEYLKREAKVLCRNSSLTHSEALDQIAHANGYANWSLLMKHCGSASAVHKLAVVSPAPFEFLRSADEVRQALRVIPYERYGPLQDELARQEVDDICHKFASASNAVDYAVGYVTCLLAVPKFSINSGARAYHEMRRWLPYYVQPIDDGTFVLVNRHYKPVGTTGSEWVNYNEFPHLHMQLDIPQLWLFSHGETSRGYLFDDGCKPWRGRKTAKAYLDRLRALQAQLNDNE